MGFLFCNKTYVRECFGFYKASHLVSLLKLWQKEKKGNAPYAQYMNV